MGSSFTHLHNHTEYSMLDGAARVGDMVARAVADGQPAIGITDHGNMYGVLDFYKAARAHGIKPIIGTEAYMAAESRHDRPVRRGRLDDGGGDGDGGEKLYYHLTLLAESDAGYKNLLKLSSDAYLEGYFYKPRCLMPGQEIVTRNGMKPVEEVHIGDEVLTHRGRFRRVLNTASRQHTGEVYGVRLNAAYDRVTWMTGEHPVLIRDRFGNRSWTEAKSIRPGRRIRQESLNSWNSWVCLPRVAPAEHLVESIDVGDYIRWLPAPNRPGWFSHRTDRKHMGPTTHYGRFVDAISLDEHFGYLLGLYVAEGEATKGAVTWSFHCEEHRLINHCSQMVEKLTGKRVTIDRGPDRSGYRGIHVRCYSTILAELLTNLCGTGAKNKHLPSFTFESPWEFQHGLSEGVLDGDGARHSNTTILSQTSEHLAWQMRLLRATHRDDFACVKRVVLPSGKHADQFRTNFSADRLGHHRKTISDEDYIYKPVADVEVKHYDGPVYNIEVEDDHSYVSDFAMHNCDWEMLDQYHEGVIATTGCLGGVVLQALLKGDAEKATKLAARLQDVFGRDSLFVELQDHGLAAQRQTNPQLIEIAKRIKAPLLATNDGHYTRREDAIAHDALLCVQTGSTMDDPKRFKFEGEEHYLKSAAEMRHLFADYPQACDNTLWIAERADVTLEFGKPQLPSFPRPAGFADADAYLRHLAYDGATSRYGSPLPAKVTERLERELGVISSMGFSDYFLVVWDLIRYARDHKIRVGPGRGSAAGCCVAYCLQIVDLDPIAYDLLFERFLNPGRKQMPDIDMDFDERYRSDMIRYATERYGWDHVAQIVTFSTIKARAAVRDAARVLGYPYGLGDRVAKAMPPLIMGRDTPLWACFEQHPKHADGYRTATELREMYDADPDVAKVVDVAKGLEGLRRQDGIHAAAVVISAAPLTEYLPIQRKPVAGGKPEDAPIVTQYEMHGVEELGLLKMDFLGLRNLSVIERSLDLIEASTGERPDIDNVDLHDEAVFTMLQRGDSIGVFQLEGAAVRALMRSLAPTEFEDVAALVALYRPGPMAANMHYDYADRKNGRKPVEYLHPDAEEVLGETYGLCLAGDTVVYDARTGLPVRLDQVGPASGITVQAVDDDLRPVKRAVTDWRCNGERDTVRVRLRNGMTLSGTPDHLVLTEQGWKKMGSLVPADHVAVPRQVLAPDVTRADDLDRLRLLGNLLADGGLSTASAITFCNTDQGVLDAYEAALTGAFPGMHLAKTRSHTGVQYYTASNGKGHGGGASPLLTWLRLLGLKSPAGTRPGGVCSDAKYVPDFVFALPDNQIAAFLAALWDCDGYVGLRYSHYRTISLSLADGVAHLLLRLGISAAVYRAPYLRPKDQKTMTAYQVTIYDGEAFNRLIRPHLRSKKVTQMMTVASRGTTLDRAMLVTAVAESYSGAKRPILEAAGIPRWHLSPYARLHHPRISEKAARPIAEAFGVAGIERWLRCQWIGVQGVESAGKQWVYDITVEDVHNFVANGMIAHNCIYQESVMRVAQKFAGYSLTEADNLRKAAGKKVREIMALERQKFIDGCERTGYGRELGAKWMDIIEPFADYAFNRSHAFGYGYVSYQTAWLKAHHPAEYFAALLTSVKDDKDKTGIYLAACRARGIEVLVPDVNLSASEFTALRGGGANAKGSIPFGMSAIRNVGSGLVERLVAERERGGPFVDFYDFANRVDPIVLNKRTVESLIKAGAFDSLGHPRQGLCVVFEQIIERTLARRREADQGVMSLFESLGEPVDGGFDDARLPIPDREFDKSQRLAFEKEMLGLYVSDHPLLGVEAALARHTDLSIADLIETREAAGIRWVGGVITGLTRKYTKKGDLMATFVLEDLQSSIEAWVFPRTMSEVGYLLADDAVICVKGRLDNREDQAKLICMELKRPELTGEGADSLHLNLPLNALSDQRVDHLRSILVDHPGPSPVFLHVGTKCIRLGLEHSVDTSNGLVAELRVLLGEGCLWNKPSPSA